MTVRILTGDCRELLASMEAESVDSCVCDPPYGLEFMGKEWDAPWQVSSQSKLFGKRDRAMPGWQTTRNPTCRGCGGRLRGAKKCACSSPSWDEAPNTTRLRQMAGFQDWCQEWAEAVYRVLKPGSHLVAFSGTRTYHRMACAIEDAGFEIRDQLAWVYGSGFPKSHDVSKQIDKSAGAEREVLRVVERTGKDVGTYGAFVGPSPITAPATPEAEKWQGWGTALKPAHEPICLARKPLAGTVAQNVLKYGTGAINIDACRVSSVTGQRPTEEAIWEDEPSLCSSCAELAVSALSPGTQGTAESIATRDAGPTSNGRAGKLPLGINRTDTGCSDGMRAESSSTSSSIAGSGKPPTDQSLPAMTCITSTRTEATTGSRTCGLCGTSITSPITAASITAEKKNSQHDASKPAPIGRDGEASAQRRYSDRGSTNFAASPGPRGGDPEGRWPANLIHDGSEEVLAHFPDDLRARGNITAREHERKPSPVNYGPLVRHEAGNPGDSGSAARFFYAAKATTEERNAGLDSHEIVSIVGEWESADLNLKLRVDTGQSPPRVIAVSGAQCSDVSEWNTWLFGSESAGRSLSGCRFTTETAISSITTFKTWSFLARSITSGNIVDAKSATANGGSRAGSADRGTQQATITSAETVFLPGVAPAPSGTPFTISVSAGVSSHPTVKPVALMQWLVRLVTPKGGTVLDPFAGSGSTLIAADAEQFDAIGCELSPEYAAIAERRVRAAAGLFGQVEAA